MTIDGKINPGWRFYGDILLISSFFVLVGDFWDKIWGLFIHNAKIQVLHQ